MPYKPQGRYINPVSRTLLMIIVHLQAKDACLANKQSSYGFY